MYVLCIMCWNEEISLNTFVFSSFSLLLIIYNNAYTQYKIKMFTPFFILFVSSFIVMQLIEFFIWRNMKNPFYNNLFSIIGCIVLILQPVFSLLLLSDITIRNYFLIAYSILCIPYSIYKFSTKHIHSTVNKDGHMGWNYFTNSGPVLLIWLFFFLFYFIYEQKWYTISFALLMLLISYYNYNKDRTSWSMWCWMINGIMIYFAGYLLFYLPFVEKGIC